MGASVGWNLATVVPKVLKVASGLLAVVNLVVGFSNWVVGLSVRIWILGGLLVVTMDSLGGRVAGISSTGSGLAWGLAGRPLPGLNLGGLALLPPSTIAWRAGGAGRAFSLTTSLTGSTVTLEGARGMLLEFLTRSPLEREISTCFFRAGNSSSP